MTHDIQIGMYHTRDDFHLIPVKKPVVQPPSEKVLTLDIPGMSGQVDLSHANTGYPVFYEREGSWEFYSDLDWNQIWDAYDRMKSELLRQCRDEAVKVILDDEPTFYYLGKVWAGAKPTSTNQQTKFTLNYRFYPFKYLAKPLENDWLWDDFSFETDLAPQKLGDIVLAAADTTTTPIRLPPTDKPAILTLWAQEAAVNFVVRYNSEKGAVIKEGSMPAGGVPTEILLKPAASINGGTVNSFYLTLTKAAGTEVHVTGHYQPGYL